MRYRQVHAELRHDLATVSLAVLLGLAAVVLMAAGCTSKSAPVTMGAPAGASSGAKMAEQASTKASPMAKMSATSKDGTGNLCAECGGKGKPLSVTGQATVHDGTQVVKVGICGGYYSPNRFTVKASMPVRVVFDGTAIGCLGHPTFKTLGKSADITKGSATVELGTLKPGTYDFACGMGVNVGSITVR